MAIRALKFALLATVVLSAAHALFGLGGAGLDGLFADWVHNGLMVTAAVLCLLRAWRREAERSAWLFVGLGLATYAAGEITWSLWYGKLDSPPFPSLADGLWLVFYPASYAALVLLVRARVRVFHASLWLDGLIGALAVAALAVALILPPVLEATGGSAAVVDTTLAYPLGDVLLLGFVIAVFALTAWRPGRSWLLIGAGLVCNAVGDAIYTYQSAKGTWVDGSIFDLMFPLAALLLAYAAWQPAERTREIRLAGWRMLVVPATFALLAFGLTVYAYFGSVTTLAALLAFATLLVVLARTALTFRENLGMLDRTRRESLTDALTGLGNRRHLMADLPRALERDEADGGALVILDLDGFKRYNDTYGHPAGDALLARLGRSLGATIAPFGSAYRLGGDEFCALVNASTVKLESIVAAAVAALSEEGEGFRVTASHGTVLLPAEARDVSEALQLADQRLYGQKESRPSSARRQTRDVLLRVLRERQPELHVHMRDVAQRALGVGRRLGMDPEQLDELMRAAELHDIGKMAIPDAILNKPGPLDEAEQAFMRRHVVVGEAILASAPALRPVAALVRSSHERFDGRGYPDGLAGEEIPLGARIIAVCDAFDAMTSERPYRAATGYADAIAELRKWSGSQFDPRAVEAFCEEVFPVPARTAAQNGSPGRGAVAIP